MRILLISPRDPLSMISFSGVGDDSDCTPLMPNLALLTLAAMTPPEVEVELVDEQAKPIDYDAPCDFVGITGYANHRDRMREIADEFRARGRKVAIGGPFATMAPHELRDYADVLFVGEAERTWPMFIADLLSGEVQDEYRETGTVDIMSSPIPAFDRANRDDYLIGVIQASRGCPFSCEFCDVIIYLGRKQRHKTPARIVAELEDLYQLGYREVFIADDNFTASRKKAHAIVTAIDDWNAGRSSKMTWLTQLSIDVSRDTELLDKCASAGLIQAFIGIETSSQEALRAAGKTQNLKRDLVADVHRFYEHGVGIQGGMIVGFDSDTVDSFRAQFDFIQAAAIPTITLNLLNAPYGTPLHRRMQLEGRLIDPGERQFEDFVTGIRPVNMTMDELVHGARWLVNKLYAPENFLQRVKDFAALLPDDATKENRRVDVSDAKRGLALWSGIMKSFVRLGPEYKKMLLQSMRHFRRKNKAILPTIMLQYKHVVANLQRRGAWDPQLAPLDQPDFGRDARGGGRVIADSRTIASRGGDSPKRENRAARCDP